MEMKYPMRKQLELCAVGRQGTSEGGGADPSRPLTHSVTSSQTDSPSHYTQTRLTAASHASACCSCSGIHRLARPPAAPGELEAGSVRTEDAGKRDEGVQGGTAGEAERRAAAALEEEALRPDGGRRAAAAAEAARPAAAAPPAPAPPAPAPPPPRRGQSQGAALRQHEDGGLRGAQGQVRLLHGGHGGGQGDRLQVPAGRGLERGDHLADGPVQEPTGDPGRQVHPAEAAAARADARPDARPQDGPQLAERSVTCGESADIGAPIAG